MHSYKNKHFLVFGTGAVGGYYGGLLVKAGYDVTFIARGKNYISLKEKGLTLIRDEKKENYKIKIFETPRELETFDYIFICVKSKDTLEAAKSIKENIGKDTTVVSFQNGVENEEIIASIIGKDKVIGGLVFVASKLIEPGTIKQAGYNGGLIGELNCKITPRIETLAAIMQDSGIDCKISKDINGDLWNKLVWNASFNPISVYTGKTVDEILMDPKLYKLTKDIMTEVRDVALAHGYNVRPDTVEFNLKRSKGFKGFKTSMLQDFEQGKQLELDELVGIVVKKAREKNMTVPNIEDLYNKVKQKITVKT